MSFDQFITLLQDEIGLVVGADDGKRTLTDVAGWDSVRLLTFLSAVEHRTGRQVSLVAALEACTVNDLHAVTVA